MAKKRKVTAYPCVIYQLTPQNPEFNAGWQFRVHDIDDDQMYFTTKDRMYDVLSIHGMHPIRPEEMEKHRQQRQQKQ